ncbi:hypothetical protein AZA_29411 [Nitrospirillum viridazoti Y2]|nr:hypothetical protein AZA_29411 [Nitrospirillum amazonense Y2]
MKKGPDGYVRALRHSAPQSRRLYAWHLIVTAQMPPQAPGASIRWLGFLAVPCGARSGARSRGLQRHE